jgi:hypothetical protein
MGLVLAAELVRAGGQASAFIDQMHQCQARLLAADVSLSDGGSLLTILCTLLAKADPVQMQVIEEHLAAPRQLADNAIPGTLIALLGAGGPSEFITSLQEHVYQRLRVRGFGRGALLRATAAILCVPAKHQEQAIERFLELSRLLNSANAWPIYAPSVAMLATGSQRSQNATDTFLRVVIHDIVPVELRRSTSACHSFSAWMTLLQAPEPPSALQRAAFIATMSMTHLDD